MVKAEGRDGGIGEKEATGVEVKLLASLIGSKSAPLPSKSWAMQMGLAANDIPQAAQQVSCVTRADHAMFGTDAVYSVVLEIRHLAAQIRRAVTGSLRSIVSRFRYAMPGTDTANIAIRPTRMQWSQHG